MNNLILNFNLDAQLLTVLAVLLFLLILFFHFVPVGLWITAFFSGVRIGIGDLIGMRIRRVAPAMIVQPLIKATKAGLKLNTNQLEAHYLAGGILTRW